MAREATAAEDWPGRRTMVGIAAWAALSIATMLDLGKNTVGLPGRLTPWLLLGIAGLCVAAVRLAVVHVAHDPTGVHRLRLTRHDADGPVGLEHA